MRIEGSKFISAPTDVLSLRLCPTEVKEVKLAAPRFPFATPDQTAQGFAVIWFLVYKRQGLWEVVSPSNIWAAPLHLQRSCYPKNYFLALTLENKAIGCSPSPPASISLWRWLLINQVMHSLCTL